MVPAIKAGTHTVPLNVASFLSSEAHASHLPDHLGGDVTEIFVQERLVICWVARQLVKPVEQLCLNSH